MIISHKIHALRSLLEAVDLSDAVQALTFYSSAHVLWKLVDGEIDGMESKPTNAGYLLEKLALFISYFQYAVMPCPGDERTPHQWITSAGDNLIKVESGISEFEK
ncbi:hypothetical protein [Prosthecobacter sp.]|jgi:hypothetical protein|uniref:hypothetical protein n=1 Tax=Prosthecobacter sp. TaxID=1965333 RepID=UPI0037C4F05C